MTELSAVVDLLADLPDVRGEKAVFLLGTDEHIGEGLDEKGRVKGIETRVGVTPDQVAAIRAALKSKGIALDFCFLKGCGTRADFLDGAYLNVGGRMFFEHELATMQPPDVVHALKEPTSYETTIPGSFLRIGALHSGAFDDESGVALLFKKRNFAAIFDGSNIGQGAEIPIRGAMSRFAGEIAAEIAVEHLIERGQKDARIVISGGGVVGTAALRTLLDEQEGVPFAAITLVEPNPNARERLAEAYPDERIQIVDGKSVSDDQLRGADALLLTAFVKGRSAPVVVEVEQLRNMNNDGILVDVSIDERGGVRVPGAEKSELSSAEVIQRIRAQILKLGKGIRYEADDHLPKHKPRKASKAHGEAVLPYITLLLYYAARMKDNRSVAQFFVDGLFDSEPDSIRTHLIHLRNGLAFHNPAPIGFSDQIIHGEKIRSVLTRFFDDNGIQHQGFDVSDGAGGSV